MKKLHIVSKTHLDLGFTDFAETIEKLYTEKFIPKAIEIASQLNKQKKVFIWTTGSWIIDFALKNSGHQNKEKLESALRNGDIAPHGLAFTTHTELMDKDTMLYNLDIQKRLCDKYNLNIRAAKMTDVPGHTKAIIPLLAEYGIKLLHIGVNDSSAVPKLPQAFLWKYQGSEVVVIYEENYGGFYKNEHIDDILYFAHSMDNHGPINKDNYLRIYHKLQKDFPDYEVKASTLDEYADAIWEVRHKLPVIESEIGDSWIHGTQSDPYKTAAVREMIKLKNKWKDDKSLSDEEHSAINEYILKTCEHTWGMDVKKHLSDWGLHLKDDFLKSKEKDKPFLNLFKPQGFWWKYKTLLLRLKGVYEKGSYSKMEKSWAEQRAYINIALDKLSKEHRKEVEENLSILIPKNRPVLDGYKKIDLSQKIKSGSFSVSINEYGAIKDLTVDGVQLIKDNGNNCLTFKSFGADDYEYWLKNYSRNVKKHKIWVIPDFARPMLEYIQDKYPQGDFSYKAKNAYLYSNQDLCKILIQSEIEKNVYEPIGIYKFADIVYTLDNKDRSLTMEIILTDRELSRLPQALFCHFNIAMEKRSLKYIKLSSPIDPYDVVENGSRNLAAVERVEFSSGGKDYVLKNCHCSLAALGKGKILKFDNTFEDIKDGISFNLYNNVWGTNFPLWYGDNAYYKFVLKEK